jgi:hypothetical protein
MASASKISISARKYRNGVSALAAASAMAWQRGIEMRKRKRRHESGISAGISVWRE